MTKTHKILRLVALWLLIITCVSIPLALQRDHAHLSKIENNIYGYAAQSVVEDGDLNLINNVSKEMAWVVSSTYNHPDIRQWGSAVLWAPFYLYAKTLNSVDLGIKDCELNSYDVAQAMGTIFFTLLFFVLAYLILKKIGLVENFKSVSFIIFFGTPFWWYSIMEPSGTDILGNLLISFSFLFFLWAIKKEFSYWNWILLGAIFAVSIAVRIYGIFYPLVVLLYVIFEKNEKQNRIKKILFFVIGFIVIFFIDKATLWWRWGMIGDPFFSISQNGLKYFPKHFILFSSLFGPNGFIFISPIYFFSFYGLASPSYLKSSFIRLIAFVFFLSLIATSFRFMVEELLSGKQLVAQQIILMIGLSIFLNKISASKYRKLIEAIIAVMVVWNLIWISRYFSNRDIIGYKYLPMDSLFFREIIEAWKHSFSVAVNNYGGIFLHLLTAWIPFFFFILLCVYFLLKLKRNFLCALEKTSAIFLVFIFFLISGSNILFNQQNVEEMKARDFFADKVIGKDMNLFVYDDLQSALSHERRNASMRGDLELEKYIYKSQVDYYLLAKNSVLKDPIGFLNKKDGFWPTFWDVLDSQPERNTKCFRE